MATFTRSRILAVLAAAGLSGCAERAVHDTHSGDAHALLVAETQVTQLEGAIEKRTRRIQGMQQEMQRAVDALVAPDTATTDRLFLLERTRTLSEEQARLRKEIDRLNAEVTVKRARLEALRHTLALSA